MCQVISSVLEKCSQVAVLSGIFKYAVIVNKQLEGGSCLSFFSYSERKVKIYMCISIEFNSTVVKSRK